jgi:hypothetical protein
MALFPFPGLASVGRDPRLLTGNGDPPVQRIGKFDAENISSKVFAIRDRLHLRPMLPCIGRMIERATGTSDPNVLAYGGQRPEAGRTLNRNLLPGSAGVERALQNAVGA